MQDSNLDMLDKIGAETRCVCGWRVFLFFVFSPLSRPTGWKWTGPEAHYLASMVAAVVNLFFTFYVLIWYAYLEQRQSTPKELAAALNRAMLLEMCFTVPVAGLFLALGYVAESVLLGLLAAWSVLRFVRNQIEGSQVHEQSRFRQAEAYVKMAVWGVLLVYSMVRFIGAVQEATSVHHHLMKHIHGLGSRHHN